jgi:hypothetical protein
MATKKKKATPAARVAYPLPNDNQPKTLTATAAQQAATVLASPSIAAHPEISAAANGVKAQAATVGGTITSIANTEATLASLRGQRTSGVIALRLLHANMESLVNVAIAGDKTQAANWGGTVVTRTTYAATTDPPLNATATPLGGGAVEAKCKREKGVICYLVQIGTDPNHPEAWAPPVISGGCKHTFSGLAVGTKVYTRIAIVRTGGVQSTWSDVMGATVS